MKPNLDLAPILMVRTISDYDMDERVPSTAEALKSALGERAAMFISPSGPRQLSTALSLQLQLGDLGDHSNYSHNTALMDVMDQTQFEKRGAEPVKTILTQAALRGIWVPQDHTGIVMVTSEYPILGVICAQERALGVPLYQSRIEIEPGQPVEVNPELIGFELPAEEDIHDFQNPAPLEEPTRAKTWLDIFRRKPHN